MGDTSAAHSGQSEQNPLQKNYGTDASTATLNSPEQPREIASEKDVLDGNSTQLKNDDDKTIVDATDAEADNTSQNSAAEWTFSRGAQLVFATLATLSLMVALDGTSISVALPVRLH